MLRFFDKLYCSYYKFQIRIGNRDVAPVTSALIIAFVVTLYYFSFFFFVIVAFPKGRFSINMRCFKMVSMGFLIVSIAGFSFGFLYKKRYKDIIAKYVENNKSNRIAAILFPLIAFVLFNIGWILKMLQNQGKL